MHNSRFMILCRNLSLVVHLVVMLAVSAVLASTCKADDASPATPEAPFNAQEVGQTAKPKQWDVKLGAGLMVAPKYEGSNHYTVFPMPYFAISWRDRVSLGPEGLNINLLREPNHRFGVGLTYNPGRDERGSSFFGTSLSGPDERLRGLGDIDPALGIRAFGSYKISPVLFRASFTKYTGDQNDGMLVNLGISLPYHVLKKLILNPGISTTWADHNYMQTFFGVTPQQSASSGLSAFNARSGFKDVTAALIAVYQFDRHWFLSVNAGIKQLLGDAKKSPITESGTSATFGTTVGYHF